MGVKVIKGINDLKSQNPILIKEWHPTKNGPLTPEMVHFGSSTKVWWICSKGHEYLMSVDKRNKRHQGCPYCSNHKVNEENCVEKNYPKLVLEWDFSKNEGHTLRDFTKGSGFLAWWICPKGHSYDMRINNRTRGAKCPICSSERITNDNCLQTLMPNLAKEWHPAKNGELTPNNVAPGSHKKVWWLCSKGHEWETAVYTRGLGKCGCPICDSEKRTSFPEQALLFYLRKITPTYSRYKIGGYEADVFCPNYHLAIEYDGEYFHRGEQSNIREGKKNDYLKSVDVILIRIKETKEKEIFEINTTSYGYLIRVSYSQDYEFVIQVLNFVIDLINIQTNQKLSVNADLSLDKASIISEYAIDKEQNSFSKQKPFGAKKWNAEKNGNIDLNILPRTSKKKYWWKCPTCGHEWYGTLDCIVDSLTCNKCSRQVPTQYKVTSDVLLDNICFKELDNNLANVNPQLASEWHPTKNGNLTPKNVAPKSGKRVWWVCSLCGYEWIQAIKTRNNGSGARKCPVCANNQKKKKDINNLFFSPLLIKEYDVKRNYPKKIDDYTPGSNEEVWWICSVCGLNFKAPIKTRKNDGGCPNCANKKRASSKYKRIIKIETGEIFDSVLEASNICKIGRTSISACINGHSKTAGGFHWKYYKNRGTKNA